MLSKAHLTSHSRTSGSVLSDHTVMVIQVIKIFFCIFLCVFSLPLLNLFSVVDVSGGESKVQCCKEQYCIGTQNVRSISLVQFSCSVMSNSLRPHGLQHARLPCPPPTPGAYSSSCPLSRWCYPAISSSVVPFSSLLQSFPAPGSFQMSQLFASGGRSTVVSASSSVLPMNIQDWFPLGWTGWISLLSKGLSRVFSNASSKSSILQHPAFFIVQLSHPYMTPGKTIALTR